jgi:hypothetical protein
MDTRSAATRRRLAQQQQQQQRQFIEIIDVDSSSDDNSSDASDHTEPGPNPGSGLMVWDWNRTPQAPWWTGRTQDRRDRSHIWAVTWNAPIVGERRGPAPATMTDVVGGFGQTDPPTYNVVTTGSYAEDMEAAIVTRLLLGWPHHPDLATTATQVAVGSPLWLVPPHQVQLVRLDASVRHAVVGIRRAHETGSILAVFVLREQNGRRHLLTFAPGAGNNWKVCREGPKHHICTPFHMYVETAYWV